MAEYTDTYKKYFMDKLGLPVEQFDDVITPAKRASAEHISKMNRMAKIAMEGGSMEKNLVSPTAEKYKAVLTEAEKRTAKNLLSGLSGNIGEAAPMETPYGKSFLSYTPEGKVAGKTGAALRGLGKVASKVAGPIGAALTAYDLGSALSEIQDKGAAKIAEDYKNSQSADVSPTIQEYKKNPRMADAAPKNMELRGEEESPKAGVIMTPEVVKALEEKRQELMQTRRDLEKQRRMDEYDQRARARQMRVRDTLAETGLDGY